jgi:hypothetical protein
MKEFNYNVFFMDKAVNTMRNQQVNATINS